MNEVVLTVTNDYGERVIYIWSVTTNEATEIAQMLGPANARTVRNNTALKDAVGQDPNV